MISAPEFSFTKSLTAARPLVPVDVVMFVRNLYSTDQVLAAIEEGSIQYAWDISSPAAERREVRVFWRCALPECPELDEATVYNEVLPSHWGRVRAASLQKRWWCSQELIRKIYDAGEIIKISDGHKGPDGSPDITRVSAIQFLQARKL